MATRNLKKVIRKILLNSKETDTTKRTFYPPDHRINWNKAIKYLNAKDRSLSFNAIFRPLFEEIYVTDIKEYLSLGHKLNSALKKGIRQYAKEKAKELTKTQLALKAPAQQSGPEQESVLPEV